MVMLGSRELVMEELARVMAVRLKRAVERREERMCVPELPVAWGVLVVVACLLACWQERDVRR
jgi:hypothetical protein